MSNYNSDAYVCQNTGRPNERYDVCGNTVRVIRTTQSSVDMAYTFIDKNMPHLSNNSLLLEEFDDVIREEREEFDIPYRQNAIEAARCILIEFLGEEKDICCVSNGFKPVLELNDLGFVRIVWYTQKKNISLTFVDDEVLILIDDNDNVCSENFSVEGLERHFERVERILGKYA